MQVTLQPLLVGRRLLLASHRRRRTFTSHLSALLLFFLLAAAACGESEESASDAAADLDTGDESEADIQSDSSVDLDAADTTEPDILDDAADASESDILDDAAGPVITLFGTVGEMPTGNELPAEGDVCFVRDGAEDQCTNITERGLYRLEGVPANTVGGVRYRNPRIVTFYWMLATESHDIRLTLSVDTPAVVQGYYDETGLTPKEGNVVVLAEMYPNPQAGYQAVLTPSSGDGPFYYAAFGGGLDLDATGTFSHIAMGVFLNVDPTEGPFSLSFLRDNETCSTPSYGGERPPWNVPADADVVFMAFGCPSRFGI